MKRVWFLLSVCLLTVGSLSARQLSPTEALEKAKQYLSQPNIGKIGTAVRLGTLSSRQSAASQAKSPEAAPQLVYTGARGSLNTVYVFNDNGGGFLIVSADDVATPLLGYSDTGSFDAGAIPPAMQYWLDCYSDEIEQSVSAGAVGRAGAAYAAAEARADIAPLIHTKWDQGSPYNDLCPTIAGKRCFTGCVATAMAQIMKYYNYPQHGTGSHSYTQENIEGSISADFGATTYDWNAMLDEYDADSPAASRKAVATLMYHAGVSVNMRYSPRGSGAHTSVVAESLVKYFNYDKKIKCLLRDDYDLPEWKNIVYEELSASRPVLYSGHPVGDDGHAFVCDGYQYRDGEDYFHINWGWSGAYDGYFLLTALDPNGQGAGYNSDQEMIVGIQPAFFPPTDITPAAGKVAALKTITLAFERMPYLVGKAIMVTKGEESYPAAIAAGSSNTLVITLAEELSAAGTYVLTIPAGTFGDANYAADQTMGYCNRVLSYTYTINADEPARKTTFNPTNIASVTKVSALKSVILPFTETPYPVGTTAMLTKGGENCPATIAAGSGNTLVVTPDIETFAAGSYTLTIPEGAFGDAAYAADQTSGRCNPALSYTIVVDPSFTPTSISPAEGQIFSLRTFTLDFDYTEAPRLVNSVATVTKGEESYPATITAGRGNTLVITLAEELTAAGAYALTIPAGTFGDADYAADRTSGCCNTELVYTYTITPVYYRITSDSDLTAEVISGEKKYTGDIVIPETVEQDGNVYRITAIGNSAFSSCYYLKSVTIPQSVTAIGKAAFSSCTGLEKFEGKFATDDHCCLIVNDTLLAFAQKCGITEYTIPQQVTVIGESAFKYCDKLTSVTIPESVTTIGKAAFNNCQNLTEITISNSVTTIGDYAFSACTGLKSITIPESVITIGDYAFSACTGLKSITIHEGVTTIGKYAFYGCTGLTSITIPEGVTTIGDYAFYGCTGLKSITIPESVITIGNVFKSNCTGLISGSAFYDCTGLKEVWFNADSCTSVSFNGCTSLTTVHIGENVKRIPKYAFSGCTGLTSITIPESITTIGDGAFENCTGLTSITIPKGVTTIDGAFENCRGLEEVWFNADSCTSVRFNGCTSLTTIHIGENVKWIPVGAFSGCTGLMEFEGKWTSSDHRCLVINDTLTAFAPCGLSSYTIPADIKVIGDRVFSNCSGLTSVTIPENVATIDYYAFSGCTGLTDVYFNADSCAKMNSVFSRCPSLTTIHIGENVKRIPERAFYGCSGLTSVTIPENVATIDRSAFYGCTGLTEVYFNADSCIEMRSSVFEGCTSLITIHIGENVKHIPHYAFSGCTSLISVTIPKNVTSIGGSAFYGCTGLTEVYFNADSCIEMRSSVFEGCTSLITIHIGENVKHIPHYAFSGCTSLISVTIPKNVTSIGGSAFYGCNSLKSVTIPKSVTSIGNSAFEYCKSLKSVTIPENVATIDYNAFYGCTGLTDVYFNADSCTYMYSVFGECTSLTTIHIGENVKFIPGGAFEDCVGLEEITIPNSVTSIGYSAFSGCSGLTSVMIGRSVTTIGYGAFDDCTGLTDVYINADSCTYEYFGECTSLTTVHIGKNVKYIYIDYNAFSGCTGLTEVYFNADSCGYMNHFVFKGCTSLTTIHIGENVKRIPNYAFSYCDGLTAVTIPNSVTSIGYNAFYGCTGLTEVYFNADSCIEMGSSVFEGCTSLTTIHIGENVKRIPDYVFSYCDGLTSVTIPKSVTSIGNSAFEYCKSLKSVTIPENVATIDYNAFYGCTGLTDVYFNADSCTYMSSVFSGCTSLTTIHIGENVKRIPDDAFYGCKGLTSITIPESVATIGEDAFFGCSNLQSVTAYNPTPVNIVYDWISVFDGVDYETCKLYVPAGSVDAYKAADGWKKFFVLSMGGAEPDVPDVPDDPNESENPDTPDTPDVPDVPENPDEPDEPIEPDKPDVPDTPSSVTEAQADAEHLTVYTLQGVPVLETDDAADLKTLQNGAYIVNGKKMIIVR